MKSHNVVILTLIIILGIAGNLACGLVSERVNIRAALRDAEKELQQVTKILNDMAGQCYGQRH